MGMKRKPGMALMSAMFAASLGLASLAVPVTALAASSSQPRFESVEVERYNKGYTYVEIELDRGVFTEDSKITVKDSAGKAVKASLVFDHEDDKNHKYDDDALIKAQGLTEGAEYTFTVTKVRASSRSYSVSGSFVAQTGYGDD